MDKIEFEIGAHFAFFATSDGECFGGGGGYDIEEFVDEVTALLKKHLTELLRENPNRTFSLVIETDDSKDSLTEFYDNLMGDS